MAKGDITAIREVASNFQRPMEITHKEVTYTIDGMGPFSLLIPIAEYSAKRAQELIAVRVKEWAEVVGKTIESK